MMKHDSVGQLRFIPPIRRSLSAIAIVLSLVFALAAFGVPVNTSWTYQGQLRRSGAAYNGTCDFQFSLWDAASAGTQQGDTLAINGVSVVNGLFTVTLDFDTSSNGERFDFLGDARWLATSVQCSGDGGFTPLDSRQAITAAPYALSLRPGASITGDVGLGFGLSVVNTTTDSISAGIHGRGPIGVDGVASTPGGRGVRGVATEPNSAGVYGFNINGTAILGLSTGAGPAIYGQNTGSGLAGKFVGPVNVEGLLYSTTALLHGTAIYGKARDDSDGVGVRGDALSANSAGVYGFNRDSAAIWGKSIGNGSAIYGENTGGGFAGRFSGPVLVEGNLIVQGAVSKPAGSFRIDHPLDPANKFLSHSFVESPDMKNIYDGNVTTDATGSAIITLPDYFAALNRDCRYQLTVLGQFAQAIVSREIAGNSFEIRTDKPGVKVSWQVTGIRQDAYAQAHPIVVEEAKPAEEQGLYLFPAGFGAGEEKQIGYSSRPMTPQTEQKITK
jgi:hypothetical protein